MGLDSVELVLRIEDEFGVSISDDEASVFRTVGDVYRLLLAKLDASPSCLSSRAFYNTRRAIVESLKLPRRSIRPSTSLDELIPEDTRIEKWGKIRLATPLRFPNLSHPKRWKVRFREISLAVVAVPAIAALLYFLSNGTMTGVMGFFGLSAVFALWLALSFALSGLLIRLTPRLAFDIPYRTVGDLAMGVLAMNYSAFEGPVSAGARPGREEIWTKLVDIFCDQLQIAPEEVVPDARIQDDLDAD